MTSQIKAGIYLMTRLTVNSDSETICICNTAVTVLCARVKPQLSDEVLQFL